MAEVRDRRHVMQVDGKRYPRTIPFYEPKYGVPEARHLNLLLQNVNGEWDDDPGYGLHRGNTLVAMNGRQRADSVMLDWDDRDSFTNWGTGFWNLACHLIDTYWCPAGDVTGCWQVERGVRVNYETGEWTEDPQGCTVVTTPEFLNAWTYRPADVAISQKDRIVYPDDDPGYPTYKESYGKVAGKMAITSWIPQPTVQNHKYGYIPAGEEPDDYWLHPEDWEGFDEAEREHYDALRWEEDQSFHDPTASNLHRYDRKLSDYTEEEMTERIRVSRQFDESIKRKVEEARKNGTLKKRGPDGTLVPAD